MEYNEEMQNFILKKNKTKTLYSRCTKSFENNMVLIFKLSLISEKFEKIKPLSII